MRAPHGGIAVGLGKTTVINWVQRFRERGHLRPDPRGRKPSRIEPERERIFRILAEQPDISITGLRNALAAEGAVFAISTVSAFLRRHGLHPETRPMPARLRPMAEPDGNAPGGAARACAGQAAGQPPDWRVDSTTEAGIPPAGSGRWRRERRPVKALAAFRQPYSVSTMGGHP